MRLILKYSGKEKVTRRPEITEEWQRAVYRAYLRSKQYTYVRDVVKEVMWYYRVPFSIGLRDEIVSVRTKAQNDKREYHNRKKNF